jgi:plasmid maintenance system antidote protein VapI
MPKHSRYSVAKKLILANQVSSLVELFDIIKKTETARLMHMAPSRLTRIVNEPDLWTMREINKMSEFLEVDRDKLLAIVWREAKKMKVEKGK